ncbi:MAG: hypothetical protein GX892_13585 [Thermoanaerobacteraceae bacterium]|nr:hypothetical protein [Thermoanaerobacteraceae bacterium]
MANSLGEWTYGEIYQLRKMTAEGKGNEEIAEALGRSVIAVKEKKRQLKIRIPKQHKPKNSSKPWTEEDIAELERLFHQGKNDKEIGEILGRTWPAIRSKRYTLGLHVKNAGKKIDYSENADNILSSALEYGKRYIITTCEIERLNMPREMVFCGIVLNKKGRGLFLFKSVHGGYTETFTAQQLMSSDIKPIGEHIHEAAICKG